LQEIGFLPGYLSGTWRVLGGYLSGVSLGHFTCNFTFDLASNFPSDFRAAFQPGLSEDDENRVSPIKICLVPICLETSVRIFGSQSGHGFGYSGHNRVIRVMRQSTCGTQAPEPIRNHIAAMHLTVACYPSTRIGSHRLILISHCGTSQPVPQAVYFAISS